MGLIEESQRLGQQERTPDKQRFRMKALLFVGRSVRQTLLFLAAGSERQRKKQNQNTGGGFYQSAGTDCVPANSLILSFVRVACGRNPTKYITR